MQMVNISLKKKFTRTHSFKSNTKSLDDGTNGLFAIKDIEKEQDQINMFKAKFKDNLVAS